jgi:hypothetical protein
MLDGVRQCCYLATYTFFLFNFSSNHPIVHLRLEDFTMSVDSTVQPSRRGHYALDAMPSIEAI